MSASNPQKQHPARNPSGADIVVRLLERQGITTVAGIPGGAILPFYDALSKTDKIHHVLARHEQGAGFMAQGICAPPASRRSASRPAVPGDQPADGDRRRQARLDPIVAITGQVPKAMIGTDAFQEVDTWPDHPDHQAQLPCLLGRGTAGGDPARLTIAASGRPGPVLVDIPKDVRPRHRGEGMAGARPARNLRRLRRSSDRAGRCHDRSGR